MSEMTLDLLKLHDSAVISEILLQGPIRRRFYDIGCIRGASIRPVGVSPFGGPRVYALCGALIAIRPRDAAGIRVRTDAV